MTQSFNELINHEAVYRTAPATPGLLNSRSVGMFRLELVCMDKVWYIRIFRLCQFML